MELGILRIHAYQLMKAAFGSILVFIEAKSDNSF